MNKVSLINQLKIERQLPKTTPPRRHWGFVAGASVLAAVGLGLAAFFLLRPDIPIVEVSSTLTASANVRPAGTLLEASGYVVARRQATVSAKTTGRVEAVLVEEGQHVTSGEVVARLDPSNARPALEQAEAGVAVSEANYQLASAQLAVAEKNYQRQTKLHLQGFSSDAAVDEAEGAFRVASETVRAAARNRDAMRAAVAGANQSVEDTVLRAPFTGVVIAKTAQPGEMVSPTSAGGGFTRTGICTIVDMDSLEVDVDVGENFINRVQPGSPVDIVLNAYPQWKIPGEVIAIVPTADRSKATVAVRVGLKLKDSRIIPDMGARVSFLSEADKSAAASSSAISAPLAAIHQSAGSLPFVFVVRDNRVERRAVRLGEKNGQTQYVLAGLSAGELVVTKTTKPLHDGERVKAN